MGDKKDDKGVVQKISDGIRFAPDAVFDSIGDSQEVYEHLLFSSSHCYNVSNY